MGEAFTASAAAPTSKGVTIDSVNVRKSATTSSKSLGMLKKGVKVTISNEVFTSGTSVSGSSRWYKISGGGKNGYIRADFIKVTAYGNATAFATDDLNYRAGAGTSMSKKGCMSAGTSFRVCHAAKSAGGSSTWYRVIINKKHAFVCGDYIAFDGGKVSGSKGIASKLQANATNGGRARYVGTLNKSNCSRVMSVKGDSGSYVPQGMAYSGSRYYIVFGMGNKQRIVTYAANGKRMSSTGFTFNMGKPNGIAYNPITKLCYIFRGSQKTVYTWNPATKKFGRTTTPYSSSGIAYDSTTKKMYASSLTGIRAYSGDGKFNHEKLFSRCSHSGKTYVQDCGAGKGYVFHALSGSYKFGTNYLDVYRAKDGKYLGSFKVDLGELEGVIVDSKGYVQLLVNCGGTYTEWIWKTPINVKNLK
jgi:uncharacterized protein YgiM (DUF1202 family)